MASNNDTIGNCTFHGNTGSTNSAAMYVNSGTVWVRATIFDESGYDACELSTVTNNNATIESQGYNIDRGESCQFGTTTGTDQSKTDAKLANLANNGGPTQTHALLAGSPAIDSIPYSVAKIANFVPSTDQRGVGRPQVPSNKVFGGVVDIGAFEYVYLPTLTPF